MGLAEPVAVSDQPMSPGLSIYCPVCDGKAGEPCITRAGKPTRTHVERVKAETKVKTNLDPAVTPPATESIGLDAWLNGIHQGDALELMGQMPDGCVDLVVTSPPYNRLNSTGSGMRGHTSKWTSNPIANGYGKDGCVHGDAMDVPSYVLWQQQCVREMCRLLAPDGAIFYNHSPRHQRSGMWEDLGDQVTENLPSGFELRDVVIWDKRGGFNMNPGRFNRSYENIHIIARHGEWNHPETMEFPDVWPLGVDQTKRGVPSFPLELPRRAIRSTPRGKVALDPFMGSGTTAVAAVLEGWSYIGIELDAERVQAARARLTEAHSDTPHSDTPHSDTPHSDTPHSDTPHSDTPHSDTPHSDTPHSDTPQWARVPTTWTETDRAVYEHIKAAQGGRFDALPLVQKDIAAAVGKRERVVSRAVFKLKSEGYVTVHSSRRGPSLYSTTTAIPRWPVRIAGGIGSAPVDTPHSDTPHSDTPHSDTPHSDTPHSDTPHSDTPHSDTPHSDTPQWARVPTTWTETDRAVYEHIKAAQGGRFDALPLVQKDIAAAVGKGERVVSRAVFKLKSEGYVTVHSSRRGPSLYSTTTAIPRWPVRIAGAALDTPQRSRRYPALGYPALGYPALGYPALGYPALNPGPGPATKRSYRDPK